jgi:phosphomannomutase
MIAFGTGGWRAIIGEEFTKENDAEALPRGGAPHEGGGRGRSGIAIGFDRRFLSREAARWAAEVMAAEGVRTHFIAREAPTPLIMYTVRSMGLAYGMAVDRQPQPRALQRHQAFTRGGRDASLEVTEPLGEAASRIAGRRCAPSATRRRWEKGLVTEIAPENGYLDAIIKTLDMDAIRRRNLRIVLDPMYGVSRTSLQTILLTARCDVDVIHERHDASSAGACPRPTWRRWGRLGRRWWRAARTSASPPTATRDRIGVIDDTGRFIHPNEILVLLYYYLLKYKGWRGPVVRNLATTHLLDKVAAAFGETCYEVPVGFKHISAAMECYGAIIGGESSGGLAVRATSPARTASRRRRCWSR